MRGGREGRGSRRQAFGYIAAGRSLGSGRERGRGPRAAPSRRFPEGGTDGICGIRKKSDSGPGIRPKTGKAVWRAGLGAGEAAAAPQRGGARQWGPRRPRPVDRRGKSCYSEVSAIVTTAVLSHRTIPSERRTRKPQKKHCSAGCRVSGRHRPSSRKSGASPEREALAFVAIN